ncbi:type II toxin-antitoxin system VapC family toxin [Corynebacterium sp. c8Ua_172]|uniref:Type II toxin-antitoxin system VapC family toxin n=1 Tax=Corynebacterium meitnerae TaxID=2913498 RepID=A0A9X3LTC7_9CORY|nr:type II toxin-antitoxin system VapC family toxin [Corynebacterium meitnerae]
MSVIGQLGSLAADDLVMSSVVLGELLVGVRKAGLEEQERRIRDVSRQMPLVGINQAEAAEYASIRVDLEQRGQLIGPNDLWIAAQARANNLTLVTANEREFARVPGLRVENWES